MDIEQLKIKLHREYLDPLWQTAALSHYYEKKLKKLPYLRHEIIKRARERVYEWLAFQTGRRIDDVHVRMMDEVTCLMAIELLQDVEYETIRKWAVKRDRQRKRIIKGK